MSGIPWKLLGKVCIDEIDAALRSLAEQGSDTQILALVCESELEGVVLLQRGAAALGIRVVGAVVPGLFSGAGLQRNGALLLALGAGARYEIVPLIRAGARTDDSAVQTLAAFADRNAVPGGDTLFLLIDAMTPDVASLLDRLYLEIGDQVAYAGSSVGSETFQSIRCVFDNETFLADAVLAILLPAHPGATLAHHYRGSVTLRVATATVGNRIGTIDGSPAFDVYRELLAGEYGIALERDTFYRYAVHFPFALHRAQGEPLVRIPVATDDDGAVFCVGEVPENALLSVVRAIDPGNPGAAREVGASVQSRNAPAVLGFYCAGRLMHLGEDAANAELKTLADALAPTPLAGALSLGEIGCAGQQNYPAFHNATLVAIPWR